MRRVITILMIVLLSTIVAQGQIKIGGNVYGGGNKGNVEGSTKVTVRAGDIGAVAADAERPVDNPRGHVFGGARMANVGGSSFVHIDGEHASGYILINQVFGGNDIAGTIGTAAAVGAEIPSELTAVKKTEADATDYKKNAVDSTFNSYVRISTKATNEHYTEEEITAASTDPENPAYGKSTTDVKPDPNAQKVYIGQLFGGGNGDFTYTDENGDPLMEGGEYIVKQGDIIIARSATPFVLPELDKTYLEIKGGSIVYGYGGGNNATVKEQNIIHIDNPSAVVNHIKVDANGNEDDNGTDLLTEARFKEMGINTTFSFPSSGAYQIGRFFGGNNKAEMSIRPTWNLLAGKVRNLYSGGNKGSMTSPEGLLLEIKDSSTLIVDNLYGGCRMADVKPTVNGEYNPCGNLPGYHFPAELSARVLVNGGHINNVYGGNDVTGIVYGGNAVGIHTTVYGDVYGGGNGAYPYTDSESMKGDDTYGDFFFSSEGYNSSTEALNAFRPNAEQVSLHLKGTDANHPTVIKGSVFVGGNCASLATKKPQPLVELKIGSHVIADKVFLGNNGEKMVDPTLLGLYKTNSTIGLTDESVFASYMEGVAMPLKPDVVFDNDKNGDLATYEDNTSWIGSFYGGGNRGSMAVSGKTSLKFDRKLIIFDKIVAGCNNANVEAVEGLNAAYEGGLLGSADERASYTDGGKIKDRIELNLDNVVIRPKRWNDTFTKITTGTLTAGKEYYETDLHGTKFIADGSENPTTEDPYYELATIGTKLEWNTVKWDIGEDDFISTGTDDTADDQVRRLIEGSVYGGCYNSGHVNGNVVININQDLVERDVIFAQAAADDPYTISGDRRSGVLKEAQGDDVQSSALAVYGGGYGEDTEIWGSTTINHNNGYAFQMYGGGEQGVVGKKNAEGDYVYNAAYSTTVNLKGINAGYSEKESGLPIPEAEYIYGGGNEGDVLGDSYVYLGNGRIYDAFGGASNADIYGGTEVHIGCNGGFPWIRDNVYGGNDFGGIIRGDRNHYMVTSRTVFEEQLKRSSTYVKYIQGRVDSIFGGNYGSYDYVDRVFKDYTNDNGSPKEGFSFPHLSDNSFVHFVPEDHSSNHVGYIFGGSAGFPGHERLCNSMQKDTYVLLDDTKTKDANRFANVDVYGGGAFAGVGTDFETLGAGRTAVDLFAGSYHNIYGGCNQEGLVGYTRVNVPAESTAKVNALFGGGKGYDPEKFKVDATKALVARFCDHYVTCVDFKSKKAIVEDGIYGGNENCRIACDTYINIEAPVMQSSGYQANIYGAGYGRKTVSGRTNVFMNNGSNAYKVFGGGRDGNAFNFASLRSWLTDQYRTAAGNPAADVKDKVDAYGNTLNRFATYLASNPITLPSTIGTYVNAEGIYDGTYTNDILPTQEKPMPDYHQTNVHIMNGGNVSGYAYGGGYGKDAVVSGSTFIELKGGNVNKDVYGGGEGGPVFDEFGLGVDEDSNNNFVATTNVNIEGGMARNVYGGGYLGSVGKHHNTVGGELVEAAITDTTPVDIPGVANVTIGKLDGTNFYNGVPAIQRNAYGGGEGGSVYGTSNLTINNGYIGYRYKNTSETAVPNYEYVPELDDNTPNAIELAGNAFGGGYVINSFVDSTNVTMYGGTLRGSLYGGGELGPIGRGTMKSGATGGFTNGNAHIYQGGTTYVKLYDGHVLRNVFGGGRGKDSWGGDGTKYMDADLVATLDLKSKGFVFGKTEVDVYGGEVGTSEGVAQGYGNVFGAGDVGCVYSATGTKSGERYDNSKEGYYYANNELTEDCKVLVEPWCKAKSNVSINGVSYAAGKYVPTSALNYLGNKTASEAEWTALGKTDVNKEGIIIHNAVFAGGNTSPGSTEVFANTPTVFGNATASIHDVFHRDLISIGRGRVGGLYGDGNLTLVDGYRELNITNYGTDYYNTTPEITLEQYKALPVREAAYYEIRYKCLASCTDKNGKTYAVGATITADEMLTVFEGVKVGDDPMIDADGKPLATYWEENGVCSRYAGRPMNTIQRADFCGVFGSRMVMQGAQDRVPEIADYTNYTINRVREVSLNKKESVIGSDTGTDRALHGNYFGIYSIVNYFGALTSDVDFQETVRVTDNTDEAKYKSAAVTPSGTYPYGTATYKQWKEAHKADRTRNNGNSHNKVALASGVYLELTTEKGTGTDLYEKDWGYITGVVELDLINVQTGIGGGFVYAKNEHGTRSNTGKTHTTITDLNTGAVTQKDFIYTTDDENKDEWQSSGNFVHSTQVIIDDCYNVSGKYKGTVAPGGAVPAHYWYIQGSVYVYDQYISAYTGAPNAYSEQVEIPLTITAASHGTMKLLNVQPNYYAYYASSGNPLADGQKLVINDVTYYKNDPISYWDYYLLSQSEKNLFVPATYVTIGDCKVNGTPYAEGTVLLPEQYNTLKNSDPQVTYEEGGVERNDKDFDYFFRSSNNLSHDTGFILTYKVNNPTPWDTWYTPYSGSQTNKKQTPDDGYNNGPTYRLIGEGGLLGQREYKESDVISENVYTTYKNAKTTMENQGIAIPEGQAAFETAYVITSVVNVTDGASTRRFNPGAVISATERTNYGLTDGNSSPAYICIRTIQLGATDYIYQSSKMSLDEKNNYISGVTSDITAILPAAENVTKISDLTPDQLSGLSADQKKTLTQLLAIREEIKTDIVPAYYCTTAGLYGGNYYQGNTNYRGLEAWSSMSETDRQKFEFNYDAFDLLIDPHYGGTAGKKYQYDGAATKDEAEQNKAGYSLDRPVDYTATYNGSDAELVPGKEYTRQAYEALPNEKRYYSGIVVDDAEAKYYVVNTSFQIGNTPYAIGATISSSVYESLGDTDKGYVTELQFNETGTYYYCREPYTGTTAVTPASGVTGGKSYTSGEVPIGVVIDAACYGTLPNKQTDFTIHGIAPTEVSTLYVSRNSDIFDLSTEKIITVIYQYDYEEADASGNITPQSERHVVNIHLTFKSGIPLVEDIRAPQLILPGDNVALREPVVTPGAYEITGGGWEIFQNEKDAESHINGIEYSPNFDPLYWYQNGYFVAYYAKTYLGKTYSNHVPLSVANYHDLKKVLDDTEHHYYVDNAAVKRNSKIYINDATNGASQFKQFYDLSKSELNEHVRDCRNLEFILHTNVNHTDEWTPIGEDGHCFAGNFHGDGYHIDGLDHSLFGNLCGSVYNLGVTGSFTSAGIADQGEGFVENCWINTTGTPDGSVKAVFGDPTAGDGTQIRNCYYPSTKNYNITNNGRGLAAPMSENAFYNGTVTYDLNEFYLAKRYNDHVVPSSGDGVYEYAYYKDVEGTLTRYDGTEGHQKGKYDTEFSPYHYVEDRYGDGDFRYADGVIPETEDVRTYTTDQGDTYFYPIWPDDYLFFGQTLTYGYEASRAHQEIPSHINRSGNRLQTDATSNRVYRAPAYFQSKEMSMAHFNPKATFAQTKSGDASVVAYKNMTAIDFTGGNGDVSGGYKKGLNSEVFYAPLLDDDGLIGFRNIDLTQNLLVYTGTVSPASAATDAVVSAYLPDVAYGETDDTYRTVAIASTNGVKGHQIVLNGSAYTATKDHLLVDKQDFNCPIQYTFGDDYRMWYQRTPDLYVNLTQGWETVSLPFKAELVTTQDKGEITHFYSKSPTVDGSDNRVKIGHEYWLREYKGQKENTNPQTDGYFTAAFNYPDAAGSDKTVENTFLWDYYYKDNERKDKNTDTYQRYYETERSYQQYPRLAQATPYIIGFPGTTYYEFDLSGNWIAQNTYPTAPLKLDRQTITFASNPGITIKVSDDEPEGISSDGYIFKKNYLSKDVTGWLMNSTGNAFERKMSEGTPKEPVAVAAVPFRPYFEKEPASGSRQAARAILFDREDSSFAIGDDRDPSEGEVGTLTFFTKRHVIGVTSTLREAADVHIYNMSGQSVASFTILPGETVERDIPIAAVYIVRAAHGRYTKKIAVK